MKTKLIILTAVAAIVLYACSDRDEETRKEAIESVKKSNQEKIKLNKSGIQSREAEPQAISDTIVIKSGSGLLSEDPNTNLDPNDPSEGGDPKGLPPRK
ncbi:hypothetical protein LXM63_04260 [Chryseobacterium gleum]|uniref:hypothetical protein n=1 Tax=Chryseobacterium gleum TaxID=250 RepID=UPI001E637E9B|nr:hypothetical protein [Chryseobacterium gleum]MCE4064295.1 hypothetical protein [Chryseobacterium gleum]